MKTYETTVYNQHVRDALKDGHSHGQFDDRWADQRFVQVKADNIDEARTKILNRHPERKGFVIVNIVELPDFD